MRTLMMGPYWKVILYGSMVGVGLSIGILNLYYLIFFTEYTSQSFADAIRWGAVLALVTSALVICGTIAVARQLGTRRGKILFITLSVLSPVAGWLLLGMINGLIVSWYFFFGFPLIAISSGIVSGIIATFAMFFLPRTDPGEESTSTDAPLSLFEFDSLFPGCSTSPGTATTEGGGGGSTASAPAEEKAPPGRASGPHGRLEAEELQFGRLVPGRHDRQ